MTFVIGYDTFCAMKQTRESIDSEITAALKGSLEKLKLHLEERFNIEKRILLWDDSEVEVCVVWNNPPTFQRMGHLDTVTGDPKLQMFKEALRVVQKAENIYGGDVSLPIIARHIGYGYIIDAISIGVNDPLLIINSRDRQEIFIIDSITSNPNQGVVYPIFNLTTLLGEKAMEIDSRDEKIIGRVVGIELETSTH